MVAKRSKYCIEGDFCSLVSPKDAMSPNFTEKSFVDSHKTLKFMNVFSLSKVLLYGTSWNVSMQMIRFIQVAPSPDKSLLTFLYPRMLNSCLISHCRSCCVKPLHSFRYSSRPVWHWGCVRGGALWRRWRPRDSSCSQVGGPALLLSSYWNHFSFLFSSPSLLLPGERYKAFRGEAQDLVLGQTATPLSGEHLHPCTAVLFLMGKTHLLSVAAQYNSNTVITLGVCVCATFSDCVSFYADLQVTLTQQFTHKLTSSGKQTL